MNNNWKNAKDDLPENNDVVLALFRCKDGIGYTLTCCEKDDYGVYHWYDLESYMEEIIAWQKLPEVSESIKKEFGL